MAAIPVTRPSLHQATTEPLAADIGIVCRLLLVREADATRLYCWPGQIKVSPRVATTPGAVETDVISVQFRRAIAAWPSQRNAELRQRWHNPRKISLSLSNASRSKLRVRRQ